MKKVWTKLIKDESGQGMAEYGLILALVAVVAMVALTDLGTQIGSIFQTLKDKMTPTSTTP